MIVASQSNPRRSNPRRGGLPPISAAILGSLVLLAVLILAFVRMGGPGSGAVTLGEPLVLYCAAGVRPAIDEIVGRYTAEFGARVAIQYGGSGTLLGQIEVNPRGDLYLAADDSYVSMGLAKGLLAESIPLATQHPVIGVRAGNPRGIASIDDLLAPGVSFALANPDAAAIGRVTRNTLQPLGLWAGLESACRVFKPTVSELAADVKIGAVDAAIIWDCTAAQVEGIEAVEVSALAGSTRSIEIAVLTASEHPASALHLARYIAARDRGGEVFDRLGYGGLARDAWADCPQLLLNTGSMLTAAARETGYARAARLLIDACEDAHSRGVFERLKIIRLGEEGS